MQTEDLAVFFKGDRLAYDNAEYLDIRVTRSARDGSWIDIFCYDNHTLTSWTKRMKLPLPAKWSRLSRRSVILRLPT